MSMHQENGVWRELIVFPLNGKRLDVGGKRLIPAEVLSIRLESGR
jgi:hypothetical protein